MSSNPAIFDTSHLRKDIKKHSIAGGVNVFASHVAGMAIEIASVVVLARLLTPKDFGLIAMVLTFTAFARLFKDIGLSSATIRQPDITHEQVSVLFWINVLLGLVVTGAVAAMAPVLSWFYKEPRLFWITLALAPSFLFGGVTVQHEALLRRQMRFGPVAMAHVGGIFFSVVVALLGVWAGLGYWALVFRNLTQSFFHLLIILAYSHWRPGRPRRGTGARALMRFGAGIAGFNVVNYFSRNMDAVLIGKFWGAVPMGLYAQAYKILLFPIDQIRTPFINVGLPALSMLQKDPEAYRRYYRGLVSLIALLSMPLVGFLFVCADAVIFLFLGPQWLGAADIFRWLALVAILQPVVTAGRSPVMLSMGKGKRYFHYGVVTSILTVLSFCIGVRWGAEGVAQAYAISNFTLMIATTPWCLRDSPVGSRDLLEAMWRPLVATGFAVAAAGVFRTGLLDVRFPVDGARNAAVILAGCIAVGCLVGVGGLLALPGGRSEANRVVAHARQIVLRRKAKKEMSPT